MESKNNTTALGSENYLRELVFILSVRKALIFFVAIVIFIVVLAVAFLWPAKYVSEAQILVSRKSIESSLGTLENVDYRIEAVRKEDLTSEAQLLTSNDLLSQLIFQLEQEGVIFEREEQEDKNQWIAEQVARVKGKITVDPLPFSKILDISFVWDSPENTRLVLKRLLELYLKFRGDLENYSGKKDILIDISNNFLERYKEGNKQLSILMSEADIVAPDAEIKNNLEIKLSLSKTLEEGRLKQIDVDKNIQLLTKKLKEKGVQFFSFLDNIPIAQFSKQLQELFVKKAQAEGVFLPTSKAVQGMEMQLNTAHKNLVAEVESLKTELEIQSDILSEQNTLLEERITELDRRNKKLKMAALNIETVEKENKVLEASFETFYKRKEESLLASNHTEIQASVYVVSEASFPLSPAFPNKKVLIPFGFIIACLSGLIVGFLTEFFDHSFKRPEDISNVLKMKHLVSINDIS